MLCLISTTFAQGDYEAFRFSQIEYQGTARYMGAGGAFSATGGEFSAISVNPAAIGLYKRHEVTFTPLSLASPATIPSIMALPATRKRQNTRCLSAV